MPGNAFPGAPAPERVAGHAARAARPAPGAWTAAIVPGPGLPPGAQAHCQLVQSTWGFDTGAGFQVPAM